MSRCATKFCRGTRAPDRSKCWKCTKRAWRAAHPVEDFFNDLRARARRRGIAFELSLEDFRQWCAAHDFLARKGRHPGTLQIDRIQCRGPYSLSNIRPLEMVANSTKGGFERMEHAAANVPFFTEAAF